MTKVTLIRSPRASLNRPLRSRGGGLAQDVGREAAEHVAGVDDHRGELQHQSPVDGVVVGDHDQAVLGGKVVRTQTL